MRIEGASALVAGGASGLGAATARRLHGAGARVTIADLNAEKGEALAGELGERAAFAACDVTDPDQVQAAVSAARDDSELRISVCCAGVGWAEKVAGKRGPHQFEPFGITVTVNLIGTFNVLRLAATAMLANEPDDGGECGVIINTASIAAYDGQIGQIAYAASKGGVVGLTLPAARDLASARVRVCTIAPGLFDTPLLAALPEEARAALGAQVPHPNRLGTPEEYAALAAHIVENPMLNGEVIRLDGGLRMPPR
jgi:3-hydroxyacyl-CoA dehydrogenase/3-hydroxy-2-methylbutyryl-CoA dehydrogenase